MSFFLNKFSLIFSFYSFIRAFNMENKPQFRPDPKLKLPDQVRQVVRYHHYVYRNFLIPSGGRSQGLGFDPAAGLECPGVFVPAGDFPQYSGVPGTVKKGISAFHSLIASEFPVRFSGGCVGIGIRDNRSSSHRNRNGAAAGPGPAAAVTSCWRPP